MILSKVKKKVVFLTGTRADFGKLKSLISVLQSDSKFIVDVFVTGMHLQKKYGFTVNEIIEAGFKNIFKFKNFVNDPSMEVILANTIKGFSKYIKKNKPDLIVIHGDRVEALAGAIAGAINNVLVSHIEGGEVSGTIDESIRHAVSKFSHIHFTTDMSSKKRLIQLGEKSSNIFILGSPDFDLMKPSKMIPLSIAKDYYDINFIEYGILLFHPVTTELHKLEKDTKTLVAAVKKSKKNFIVIYPNNDSGSQFIIEEYLKNLDCERFKLFPSLRFEYFLSLLKASKLIIGNSSCGLREAPFFRVPTINIGTRQNRRSSLKSIINIPPMQGKILHAINASFNSGKMHTNPRLNFNLDSDKKFYQILVGNKIWNIPHQKNFHDISSIIYNKHFK
mgnify:CR=1 FL=1